MSQPCAIAAAFERARDYDRHAVVQRRVAEDLADAIAALPLSRQRGDRLRLLEIGCGTGFLTAALARRGLGGDWLVTDIAPAMLERCHARMAGQSHAARLTFQTLDGQAPALPDDARFDLVCSSLAFQWFDQPATAADRLARHLAPGGVLAFTTLLAGTFAEWTEAHRALGLRSGVRPYPPAEVFGPATLAVADYRERHRDARVFLRALKAIGAGTPAPAHQPLAPAALRAVMARFEAQGCWSTYRVGRVVRRAAATRLAPSPARLAHPFPERTGACP